MGLARDAQGAPDAELRLGAHPVLTGELLDRDPVVRSDGAERLTLLDTVGAELVLVGLAALLSISNVIKICSDLSDLRTPWSDCPGKVL